MPKISVITPSIRPAGLEVVRKCLLEQTFRDFEWITDLNWTGESDLNASLNRCVRRASGELIVFLQDYIEIKPEGLQKFWDAYQKDRRVLYTAPVGKKKRFGRVDWDWRKYREYDCNWQEWEIDWGACAKSILYEVGGFDEVLDEAWGFDNVSVGLRADLIGYKFANIKDNLAVAYDHDAHIRHPFRAKRDPMLHNRRLDQFRMGEKISYI